MAASREARTRAGAATTSDHDAISKRRQKGLARSGNARVRCGMIQLAWRFLEYQKDSALARWYRASTESARGSRKRMIPGAQAPNRTLALRSRWRGA
jgi:transposase